MFEGRTDNFVCPVGTLQLHTAQHIPPLLLRTYTTAGQHKQKWLLKGCERPG